MDRPFLVAKISVSKINGLGAYSNSRPVGRTQEIINGVEAVASSWI
jgi:hypothetical protein